MSAYIYITWISVSLSLKRVLTYLMFYFTYERFILVSAYLGDLYSRCNAVASDLDRDAKRITYLHQSLVSELLLRVYIMCVYICVHVCVCMYVCMLVCV